MSAPSSSLAAGAHLVRGLGPGGGYRFVATLCTEPAREAARRHGAQWLRAAAIGRAVGVGLTMATLTKGEERVTVQWNGSGPQGSVVVDADGRGNVRAYLGAREDLPVVETGLRRPTVGALVGTTGIVTVIRDLGLKENYVGQGELVDGELDTDLERYLTRAEQIDSALSAEVVLAPDGSILAAAAVLIQAMPQEGGDGLSEVIESARRAMREGTVYRLLSTEAAGARPMDAAMLVAAVVPEGVAEILTSQDVRFACTCDRERVLGALTSLGPADLEALVEEQGGASAQCQFCAETYRLGPDEVLALAGALRASLN